MIHQPLGGAEGQASDIVIQAEEILKIKNMFIDLITGHTSQKRETVEKDMERNKWMTAEEAVKYGIIDKIIE
jgi:ATP-dependent Clp protease protease subunit